jgi:hypothetical protein
MTQILDSPRDYFLLNKNHKIDDLYFLIIKFSI